MNRWKQFLISFSSTGFFITNFRWLTVRILFTPRLKMTLLKIVFKVFHAMFKHPFQHRSQSARISSAILNSPNKYELHQVQVCHKTPRTKFSLFVFRPSRNLCHCLFNPFNHMPDKILVISIYSSLHHFIDGKVAVMVVNA